MRIKDRRQLELYLPMPAKPGANKGGGSKPKTANGIAMTSAERTRKLRARRKAEAWLESPVEGGICKPKKDLNNVD